jgi:drug/metabolite transporter (DMT)-like permease
MKRGISGRASALDVLLAIARRGQVWCQRGNQRKQLATLIQRDLAGLRIGRGLAALELAKWPWRKWSPEWKEVERGHLLATDGSALPHPAIHCGQALLVFAAATLTIVLFALVPVTTRIATSQLDGSLVGTFRTVGAGILVVPILLLARLRPPSDRSGWLLLGPSAFGAFIGFPLLFSMGTQRTSACHASLIMAAIPLFTGLIGSAAKSCLPRLRWVIGAGIALGGETVLISGASNSATGTVPSSVLGDLLVLASCLSVATGFVAGAHLTQKIGTFAATFWAIALASIALAPFEAMAASRVPWTDLAPQCWAALLHLTVGAGVIGFVAWFWALARGDIARVSVLQFFQPVVALIFAGVILSERLTLPLLLAAATILAGVAIARSGRDSVTPAQRLVSSVSAQAEVEAA